MQSSLNRCFISTLTGAAVVGLLGNLAVEPVPQIGQRLITPAQYARNAADDDRGSGRVVKVSSFTRGQSFRGSGRVDPTAPPTKTYVKQGNAYRGSGRLGQDATSA